MRPRAPFAVAVPLLVWATLGATAADTEGLADGAFVEVAAEVGLEHVHDNGMSGELYLPEITGPGAALFDYDGDGDLDVYLVQGGLLGPGKTAADALLPPPPGQPAGGRLFRNDLASGDDGSRRLTFTDVTAASGIRALGYGMGVAVGDIDNDGWEDLYLTNLESNQLWHNEGDGTFSDVTAETGTDDTRWSTVAEFLDADGDGSLDLYVGNYVDFSFLEHRTQTTVHGAPDYVGPLAYGGVTDRLFRNLGAESDGKTHFEDVSVHSGVGRLPGSSLGSVAADFDGDGLLDLYVANDQMPNFLWMNRGSREEGFIAFQEEALLAGCAVNRLGQAEASMGVDAGDFDGDGDDDLFVAHLTAETNTLYRNDGRGLFTDHTIHAELGLPSWDFTAFGTAFFDYDNDGWLDLLAANGAIRTIEELARANDPFPLHQTNQLFRNLGDGRYVETTAEAGATFALSEVSRGLAFGDIDNDGDTDVLVANNAGPVRLLLNQIGSGQRWIGAELVTTTGRPALGARIALFRERAPTLWRRVHVDGSYASSNDPRVLFGLGSGARVTSIRAWWPSGRIEEWAAPRLDSFLRLREGTGRTVDR